MYVYMSFSMYERELRTCNTGSMSQWYFEFKVKQVPKRLSFRMVQISCPFPYLCPPVWWLGFYQTELYAAAGRDYCWPCLCIEQTMEEGVGWGGMGGAGDGHDKNYFSRLPTLSNYAPVVNISPYFSLKVRHAIDVFWLATKAVGCVH